MLSGFPLPLASSTPFLLSHSPQAPQASSLSKTPRAEGQAEQRTHGRARVATEEGDSPEAALQWRHLGALRSLVGFWAPSTFYLSLQRMLEDKRNIWTSELIYIFGRATFPFLKRGERAPYPALGGRTATSFDAPGSSSARPGAPPSSLALPAIYLFGGAGEAEGEETQPDWGRKLCHWVGTSRALPRKPASGQPASPLLRVWGQPCSLRVFGGCCPAPSWSDSSRLVSLGGRPP